MITITYVEMVGFRGFLKAARFDFPKGFVVITGRNGAGKSTVFDAIDFAFTGSINKYGVRGAKGGGLEEHLWWVGDGRAADYYVAIGLKAETGEIWEIRRNRTGDLVGDDLSRVSTILCQHAEQLADWPIALIQTTLIRDELIAAMSVDLTEQARFVAVRAALGTSDTNAHLKRFGDIVKAAELAREAQQSRHAKSHEDLGRLLTSLTETRSVADRQDQLVTAEEIFEKELGAAWRTDPKAIENAHKFVAEQRQKLNSMRAAIAEANHAISEQRETISPSFLHRLDVLRKEVATLEVQISRAQAEKAAAQQVLMQAESEDARTLSYLALLDAGEGIGLQGDACPLCASKVGGQQFAAAIRAARAVLSERSPKAGPALAAFEKASRSEREISQRSEAVDEEVARAERARWDIALRYETAASRFKSLGLGDMGDLMIAETMILAHQERTAVLEHCLGVLETSSVYDRIAAVSGRVDRQRAVVEDEALRLSQAELAVERAKQMQNVAKLVRNELLGEQLDTVLPLLKELYQRLRPHADWREIEIDVAGQVRASLNLVVGNGMNPQFLFSSGQRRAAGLAFLLALFLARPWCGLKTLLMDDPVQHVDDYRALNLVEVLSSIRKSGLQVIVAVEDAALADLLCRRLRSNMDEPGRRFELGIDTDGSAHIAGQLDIPSLSKTVLEMVQAS